MLASFPYIFLWLSGLFALEPAPNCMCSCVIASGDPPVEVVVPRALEAADAVFVGQVMSGKVIDEVRLISREFTFLITEQWKGEESGTISVKTGAGGGDCGYPFELGYTYLVYAHRLDKTEYTGHYYTNICLRTGWLYEKGVKEDLEVLRGSD